MSYGPFESKEAQAIVNKLIKGKTVTPIRKTFEATVKAKQSEKNWSHGGVNMRLCDECLAVAEVVATGRGHKGKAQIPQRVEAWFEKSPALDDDLAALAKQAVDKVRTQSDAWAIAEEMNGYPEWTSYCRGLSTRLGKPQKKSRAAAKKAKPDASLAIMLESKKCKFVKENREFVELTCTEPKQLTDADLLQIATLSKLRALKLVNQSITDKSLGCLTSLKQLRELELIDCEIKGPGLSEVKLPKLERLRLGSKGLNKMLVHCQQLTGLKELDISWSDLSDKGLELIGFAKSVQSLDVGKCPKLKGTAFAKLTGLSKLTRIEANQSSFSTAGLKALNSLPSVKYLGVALSKFPAKSLSALGELKKLEELEIFSSKVADADLEFLGNLKKLKKLNLNGNKGVTDQTISTIAKLPKLEDLEVTTTSITADSVPVMDEMKSLLEVYAMETGISRNAVKNLNKRLKAKK